MATSQITLYYTDLAPNLNYLIEDIDYYLVRYPYITHVCRYIEPKLQQTIVLKMPQSILNTGLQYNYARVITKNDDNHESKQYYFVQSLDWGSKKSIKINLLLDTLNTLSSDFITTHCDSKTAIIREHQDRWEKIDNRIIAKVDPYDEGLSGSIAKEVLDTSKILNDKKMYWVQISANATSPNVTDTHPYRSLICYEESTEYDSAGLGNDTYSIIGGNKIHYFLEGSYSYTPPGGSEATGTIGQTTTVKDGITGTLRMVKVSPEEVMKVYCTGDTFPYSVLKTEKSSYSRSCTMSNVRRDYTEMYSMAEFDSLNNLDRVPFLPYTEVKAGKYAAHIVKGISDLDRTQSYIMQINTIPAFKITLNGQFIEGYNMLMLKNSDDENRIVGDDYDESFSDYTLKIDNLHHTPSLNDKDDVSYESKIYHHSITDSTINYQGNVLLAIDWSRASDDMKVSQFLTLDDTNVGAMKIRTTLTNYTTYSPYEMTAFVDNKYNVPLFTNQWTEYVRNGYNYDTAERNRQKTLQGWNMAISAVSAVVGLGNTVLGVGQSISNAVNIGKDVFQKQINENFATRINSIDGYKKTLLGNAAVDKASFDWDPMEQYVYTGRAYDPTTMAIGDYTVSATNINNELKTSGKAALSAALHELSADKLGTMVTTQALSSINSIVSAGSAISSANAAYQYAIATKSQSKTAIAGNTNSYKLAIDNKITYEEWKPRPEVVKNIAKTFYLTGYSHPVIEKPNISSRTYFNYLQCSPHWDSYALNNTNPLWLADMTNKLNEGITVFHHTNNIWDIRQTRANWEISLISFS